MVRNEESHKAGKPLKEDPRTGAQPKSAHGIFEHLLVDYFKFLLRIHQSLMKGALNPCRSGNGTLQTYFTRI
eukprot:2116723-Amphidinium_carterae.1